MDTLLPWQQRHVLIALLFEVVGTSYLVQRSIEATAISDMLVCYCQWSNDLGFIRLSGKRGKRGKNEENEEKEENEENEENPILWYALVWYVVSNLWYALVWYVVTDTLLSWQQRHVLIALLFEAVGTSYLVQRSTEATAICGMICCYGHLATMETEACACSFTI